MARTKKLKLLYAGVILGVVMLMAISISVAGAQGEGGAPVLPCAFYGNVTIDGKPAPIGTEIRAKMDNKTCGNITVQEEGKYGKAAGEKLVVVGSAADENKIISFYVDGDKAEETALWTSGGVNRLDLSVKKTGPGVSPSAGAGEGAMPIVVVMGIVVAVVVAVTLILVGLRMRKR